MRSSMQIIHDEAVQIGMDTEAEAIRQYCIATDKAADIIMREGLPQDNSECWPDQSSESQGRLYCLQKIDLLRNNSFLS